MIDRRGADAVLVTVRRDTASMRPMLLVPSRVGLGSVNQALPAASTATSAGSARGKRVKPLGDVS